MITVFAISIVMFMPAPAAAQQAPKDAVKTTVPETHEKFKPLLGLWKVSDPQHPMSWRINSVDADTGAVDIEYFYKGSRVKNMQGRTSLQDSKLHLSLYGGDLTLIKWELDYSPTLGGMLEGKAYASGGSGQYRAYRE